MKSSFFNTPIDIRELEGMSVEKYRECPKHTTIVRHADLVDDSVFHCVPVIPFVGPPQQGENPWHREFIVPGQEVLMGEDPTYGLFTFLRVLWEKRGVEFWLVTSIRSRIGFLLPLAIIQEERFRKEATA
jgi:hypothetical protein